MELVSTNSKDGSPKLGYGKIGAETKAHFGMLNASAHSSVQTKGTFFFVKTFKGLEIFETIDMT